MNQNSNPLSRLSTRGLILLTTLFLLLPPAIALSQTTVGIKARLLSSNAIGVEGPAISSRSRVADFELRTADGNEVVLQALVPRRANEVLLITQDMLDASRLYTLRHTEDSLSVFVGREEWFKSLYSNKPLGAIVLPDDSQTDFRLFAPRATAVTLHLYLHADQDLDAPDASIPLELDSNGVWEVSQVGNHHGVFYTYTIEGRDEPGNFFYDTHPVHITDPYALVSDDSFGKAMVYKSGKAPAPVKGGRPPMQDVIAYEVHIQDFTDQLPISPDMKGSFLGMIQPGLQSKNGSPIGFDYLVSLGINTVHLMPVQEFLHYPDSEWRAAFENDPYMIEQGIATENYQWGYRTTHAFAVESRYRVANTDLGDEREQFKALVAAFHAKGISVIIDVVPNHTGENMDGRHYLFNFNAIDLPYYYRTDDQLKHIGPFGNEIKSENRPMVQRWMLDQLKHWVEDLGVDGFRIDLAGQIDEQTLIWLKNELPKDLIIYGEAWIPPSDPVVAADPDLGWYKADAPITFFQDDARNAFKGPVSNPVDPRVDRGYAGGDGSMRGRAMQGLANAYAEEPNPNKGINYLDIHDNWALADQFSDVDWDGRLHVDEAQFRIAATLLFTSLGPIVVHGGTEMMRSKGHAPLEELIKQTASGSIYLHGKRDTYNLRRANTFVWDNVGALPTDERPMDYAAMTDFWSGLMKLRASDVGAVFRVGQAVPANYYRWILPENDRLLGYVVDGRVLVLINTSGEEAEFALDDAPQGRWMQLSDGWVVYPEGCGCDGDMKTLPESVEVPAKTAMIWGRAR